MLEIYDKFHSSRSHLSSFPLLKKKTKKLPSFSISLSLFVRSRGTHARSFISCFNFRSTRVTLDRPRKLLTPGGWLEEDGKENRGHPPKTPHRLVPNERAEPDVHLIIITPNESHSLTVPPFPTFVMDFCGQLRQSLPPPPSIFVYTPPPFVAHFRIAVTIRVKPCLHFLQINLGISTKLERRAPLCFFLFSSLFFLR